LLLDIEDDPSTAKTTTKNILQEKLNKDDGIFKNINYYRSYIGWRNLSAFLIISGINFILEKVRPL